MISDQDIKDLYAKMLEEIEHPQYEPGEIALFRDPVRHYGRYLDPKTRQYALQNIVSNIRVATKYLSAGDTTSIRLLDLGCGLGMQSIIFASLGWEVLGVDVNARCIAICLKRKTYFEATLGRKLRLQFAELDFRRVAPFSLGEQYNALFSMSAFSLIQPLQNTVAKIASVLNDTGRLLLWDQNSSYMFLDCVGAKRRLLPGPKAVLEEFARHGFKPDILCGACAVPRQFWNRYTFHAACWANTALTKSLRFSFSYIFGASRAAVQ